MRRLSNPVKERQCAMEIIVEPMPGLFVIQPKVFNDQRGFFLETFQADKLKSIGLEYRFVQDNHSRSRRGVLRGLHFQINYPQGKLVYVPRGEVFDVAVDLRDGSPTFGQVYSTCLNDENHLMLFVPPGMAHGFCVVSETVDFFYKCTDFYHPEDEGGIVWNDPELAIPWPIEQPVISAKDLKLPSFADYKRNIGN